MRATREGRLAKNERTCHQCKLQVDLKRSWPSEATHTLAERRRVPDKFNIRQQDRGEAWLTERGTRTTESPKNEGANHRREDENTREELTQEFQEIETSDEGEKKTT